MSRTTPFALLVLLLDASGVSARSISSLSVIESSSPASPPSSMGSIVGCWLGTRSMTG
jgi:hypothetical protein